MADSTVELNTDIIIKPGQVLGKEKLRELIRREFRNIEQSIKDFNIDLKPNITIDKTALQDIEGTIKSYQDSIAGQIQEGIAAGSGKNLLPEQVQELKLLRKQFTGLEKALTTRVRGKGALPFLDDEDKSFERTLQLFTEGKYIDPKGIVRQTSLSNVQPIGGPGQVPDLPKIPEKDLQNIARYRSYIGEIRKQLEGYQSSLRSITGSREAAAEVNPLLGKDISDIKRQEKLLDSLLDPEAARRRQAQVNRAIEQERDKALRKQRQQELARNRALKQQAVDRARLRTEAQERVAKQNQRAELARARQTFTRLKRAQTTKDLTGVDPNIRAELVRAQKAFANEAKRASESMTRLNALSKSGSKEFQKGMSRNSRSLDVMKRKANEVADALKRIKVTSKQGPVLSQTRKERLSAAKSQRHLADLTSIETGELALSRVGGEAGIFSVPRRYRQDVKNALLAREQLLKADRAKLDPKAPDYTRRFNQFTSALGDNDRALGRLKTRMSEFGSVTNQTASLFRQFFRYALGYGALYQALQAIRALITGITDLEEALKSIQAVAGATVNEMRIVENGIKRVALTTQFNAKEIAQAAQILSQAGVIPTELPAAIEATARFASATGSALEVSADLITSFRNVFTDLGDSSIANILTRAINISKLTAEDLKTVVSLSSQIAKSYNLTSEQYLAAVTTLRNAGIKPSTVATGLRQGLIELFSPDSKTVKALKTRYKQLGQELSADEIRDTFFSFAVSDSPLVNVLRELQRLGFTGEGKKVFQRAYDVRAENAISALINNIGELEAASSKLTFGDAAAQAAQTQMEALSHSVRNLGAAISVFSYNLAKDALGPLEDFTDGITSSIERLDQLQTKMKQFTGEGFGQAIGTGLATGAVGAAVSRGSLPFRIASFFGAGAAGFTASVTNKSRQVDEAEGVYQSTFDKILAQFSDAMLVGAALAAPGIIRWVKGWWANAFTIPIQGELFDSSAKKSAGVAAYKTLDTIRKFFSDLYLRASVVFNASILAPIFSPVIKLIKGIAKFAKGHPVILWLGAFYGLLKVLEKFFSPDDVEKVEKQFQASLDARSQAEERYRKALEGSKEFRFSEPDTGYLAAAGSSAKTAEDLKKDIDALQSNLKEFFDVQGEDVSEVSSFLAELTKRAPEAGTSLRDKLKKEFAKGKKYEERLLKADDALLSEFGSRADSIISRAEGIRGSMVNYIQLLNDADRELEKFEQAFLDAADSVVSGNTEALRIITGLPTGLSPAEEALEIYNIAAEIYQKSVKISGTAEEVKTEADSVQRSNEQVARDVIRRIREGGLEGLDFQAAVLELTGPLNELDEEAIKRIRRASEAVQAVVDEMRSEAASYDLAYQKLLEAEFNKRQGEERLTGGTRRSRRLAGAEVARTEDEISELKGQALDFRGREEAYSLALETDEAGAQIQLHLKGFLDTSREAAEVTKRSYVEQIENIRTLNRESQRINQALKTLFPVATPEGDFLRNTVLNADLTPESVVKIAEGTNRVFVEGGDIQRFFDTFNKYQQKATDRGEDVEPFLIDRGLRRSIGATERDISRAEREKSFEFLSVDNEQNLYRKLQVLRNQAIQREIAYVNKEIDRAESDPAKERLIERKDKLEAKIIDLEYQTQTKIQTNAIKAAEQDAKRLKATNDLKIKGLEKQVNIAIDSGLLEKARELDGRIIQLKQEIIDAYVRRMRAENKTEEEIRVYVENAREDLVPILDKPATARRIGTGVRRRIERETPLKPRLGETRFESGYLRGRGDIASPEQRTGAMADRIANIRDEIDGLNRSIAKILSKGPVTEQANEAIKQQIELINQLTEEIGGLQAQYELQGGEGFGRQVVEQLKVGFSPQQISNQINTLDSSIGNLGNKIRTDLVQGLDEAADGFANALVRGEEFADGVRQALSDMAYQVAADIVKSGVMTLLSSLIGGFSGAGTTGTTTTAGTTGGQQGGFFGWLGSIFGFAKGGTVGEKSGGGVIKGPGTGTSDSIPGVVVNKQGKVTQGIAVSNGESILTAKTTGGLGKTGIDKLNSLSERSLAAMSAFLNRLPGYKDGGIPGDAVNLLSKSMPKPLAMAQGGIVGTVNDMKTASAAGAVGDGSSYTYNASVKVSPEEGARMDIDTLRRLDEGITLKIQDYLQDQMRPGGILEMNRPRAARG